MKPSDVDVLGAGRVQKQLSMNIDSKITKIVSVIFGKFDLTCGHGR